MRLRSTAPMRTAKVGYIVIYKSHAPERGGYDTAYDAEYFCRYIGQDDEHDPERT